MRAAAGLPLLAAAGALLAVALLFGEGSSDGRLYWIGAAALLTALVAVGGSLAGLVPAPVPTAVGWAWLAVTTAFVLWNGLTMTWSIAPDRSWSYLNRGLVYLALAVIGAYATAVMRRPVTMTAAALASLLFGVLGWALLGKVFPGLFPDGARVARLRSPVGYWNALALLAAFALPLALWLAGGRNHTRAVRAGGVLLLYTGVVALVLTYSRAGIVVAGVGVLLWLGLTRDRLESLAMLLAGGLPAACVAAWASTQSGLVDDLQSRAAREAAGGWFALALVLGAAAALGLAHAASAWSDGLEAPARTPWARRLTLGLAAALAAALVAVSVAAGGPDEWLQEFRGSNEVVQGPPRLRELSSNKRWAWWQEAWKIFRDAPAEGKGARTFEIARRPVREGSIVTSEPHNAALQLLVETGIVGFLLGGAAAALALVGCAQGLRRLGGEEYAAGVAVAVAVPAYLLHALADIDWDFVAVSAPVFLVVGMLVAAGREPGPRPVRPRPALAALAGVVGLAALYSLTAPWLSHRKVEDAYAAIGRGDARAAVAAARQAHQLNPLSPEPLWVWADAEGLRGKLAEAERRYEEAADLQPENWETWYLLGQFRFAGRHDPCRAYDALNRAYTLDPNGPPGERGGYLDRSRAVRNSGACG